MERSISRAVSLLGNTSVHETRKLLLWSVAVSVNRVCHIVSSFFFIELEFNYVIVTLIGSFVVARHCLSCVRLT